MNTSWQLVSALILLLQLVPAHGFSDESKSESPLNVHDSQCSNRTVDGWCDALECNRTTLSNGDALTLKMNMPHGDSLLVYGPTGERLDIGGLNGKPFDHGVFQRSVELSVNVDTLEYERDSFLKPVFKRSGKYRILIGTSFETDEHEIYGFCDVVFKHKRSK
jgi:hypothetical protein